MNKRWAQRCLAKGLLARKAWGVESDWAKDNLVFMQDLLEHVNAADARAVESVYWLLQDEQEARFAGRCTGEGASEAGLDPLKAMARVGERVCELMGGDAEVAGEGGFPEGGGFAVAF